MLLSHGRESDCKEIDFDSERKDRRFGMTLEQFIRKNRRELDQAIRRMYPNVKKLNDDERRAWIFADEFFYIWAKSAGVKF